MRAMKEHRSITLDPEVAKIADRLNRDFGYDNFSRLIEDLIRSANEATEIRFIPGKDGKPARRLFVVVRP